MKNTLAKAEELYDSQNYTEAFNAFLSEAEQGDTYAQYRIGLMHEFGEGTPKNLRAAFKYIKQSADAGLVDAVSQLGYYYSAGLGCKKNPYEAAQCFKQAGEAGDALALNNYGLALYTGEGVMRSISSARNAFLQSAHLGEEKAEGHLKQLEEYYAFDASGKIDLSSAKNSRIAIFICCLLFLFNLFFVATGYMTMRYVSLEYTISQLLFPILYLLSVLLLLFRQKAGGYLLYALMILPLLLAPVLYVLDVQSINTMVSASPSLAAPLAAISSFSLAGVTSFFSLLTYLILQKKRKGIPTWNRLMKHPFDGNRQVSEWGHRVVQYGNTPVYRADASQTKRFRILYVLFVAAMAVCAVFCSYLIITTEGTLDLHLNWNFFTSSFAMPLCIVGFFWGLKIRTSSYTVYNVTKDRYTGEEKKREKSDDMTDVIEGKILMPLLQRFLMIPLAIGVAIYYLILVCISIFGLMFPYLLSGLIVFSAFFLYKRYYLFSGRKYRTALFMGTCLLLLSAYAMAYKCWESTLSPSVGIEQFYTTLGSEASANTSADEGNISAQESGMGGEEVAQNAIKYDESPYYGQELVLTGKGIGSFYFDTYSYAAIPVSFDGLYTHFEKEEYVDEYDGINGLYKFYDVDGLVMQHYAYDLANGKVDNLEVFSPKISTALGIKVGSSACELLNYHVTFDDSDPCNVVHVGDYLIQVSGFSDSYAAKFEKWYQGTLSQLTLDSSDFSEGAVIKSITR